MSFHALESRWQRLPIGILGLAASAALLMASMAMNFRYGAQLGRTEFDKYLYGGAAAASDVLMAFAPFFFFAALRSRSYMGMFASGLVWFVTTVFAMQSAVGHAALNRMDTTGKREVSATVYKDVRAELEEARKERGFIPQARDEEVVRADLNKTRINVYWTASSECTDISGAAQRKFCSGIQDLQAELGNAMRKKKINTHIEELESKSDKLSGEGGQIASEGDPQAVVIERFLKTAGIDADVKTVQSGLAFVLAMMVLVGAGFGPYASVAVLSQRKLAIDLLAEELGNADPDQKALPGPEGVEGSEKGKTPGGKAPLIPYHITARLSRPPHPGSVPKLLAAEYPVQAMPKGKPVRLAHTKRDGIRLSAENFALWLQAYELSGVYDPAQIEALYGVFCKMDHRTPCHLNMLMGALNDLPKRHGVLRREIDKKRKWVVSTPKWAEVAKKPQDGKDAAGGPTVETAAETASAGSGGALVVPMRRVGLWRG